ncbi:C40 family peptidase [Herbiconiux ginsengi]|uniref:Cell wall-associated hydrolase, NlpC family n=1 Tax=Herbiconiux ginsengi TaxID=381665 RepID=A0A1H3JJB1_9MICO|nr:NlpC/P60 family protein [Herbiconiux ginsengi]SDY39967.1 Cell wall-associated hydrolase, NlpC family [Herbiconiux ginsengi]
MTPEASPGTDLVLAKVAPPSSAASTAPAAGDIARAPEAVKALELALPTAPAAVDKASTVPVKRGPSIRMPRVKKPTKKGAVSVVVMTFAAALVATMALPAYAFGGGGNFDSGVATDASLSGAQTLEVPDASAALAISRDNYKAPTTEELAASREAAAAAVAATEAANRAADAAAAKGATASGSGAFTVNPPSGSYSGAAIVAFAEQFVGVVPYGSGASPDTSFGCDGLTQYVFGAFGIYLPRTVSNQAAMGIPIAPEDAQAGDLMVYPIGHIGIYAGDGTMIDSPDWGRYVEHRPVWGSYYFVRIVA